MKSQSPQQRPPELSRLAVVTASEPSEAAHTLARARAFAQPLIKGFAFYQWLRKCARARQGVRRVRRLGRGDDGESRQLGRPLLR